MQSPSVEHAMVALSAAYKYLHSFLRARCAGSPHPPRSLPYLQAGGSRLLNLGLRCGYSLRNSLTGQTDLDRSIGIEGLKIDTTWTSVKPSGLIDVLKRTALRSRLFFPLQDIDRLLAYARGPL